MTVFNRSQLSSGTGNGRLAGGTGGPVMRWPVIAAFAEAATASDVAFVFAAVTMFPMMAWPVMPQSATAGAAPVLDIWLAVTSADVEGAS